MKIVLLIAACVISVASVDKKETHSSSCGTALSSVRMEVSPALLHLICSNNNQTTLVIDCGSNIWYEKVTGFCNSFDLNIGQVFMDHPLPSSTITLQLVKSGQLLDAARVAILTSQHLFQYRISVWGNRNTRFVLAIEKECTPSQRSGVSGISNSDGQSFVGKSSQHLPLVHVNGQLPRSEYNTNTNQSQTYPSYVTGGELRGVPEYLRPNKLANEEHSNYGFLKLQKLLPGGRDASLSGDRSTKIEIYRSRASKPESATGADHLHQYDEDESDGDLMSTTPESSELAKLRWMEEKRILFEQRMKFLRNFYPESEDTKENESPALDNADGTDSDTVNKLPTRFDPHRAAAEPSSSSDSVRLAEDAQSLPYTETPSDDPDREQIRGSGTQQLSRKDSHRREHTKLEYRQLSNSHASLDRSSNWKPGLVQSLYPSDTPALTSIISSTTQAHGAFLRKQNENFTSGENKEREFGVLGASNVNNSSLEALQKLILNDEIRSVLKELLLKNTISVNTVERPSEPDQNVVLSPGPYQPSTRNIYVTDPMHPTKFTRSSYHSRETTADTTDDVFRKSSKNSQHFHHSVKDGMDSSKPTTSFDNLTPAFSITVNHVLPQETSRLQTELQHNLSSSVEGINAKDSLPYTTPTHPNTRSPMPTQSHKEDSKFTPGSTSDKLNSHTQHLSTNIGKVENTLSTSSAMYSSNSSTEKLEKVQDNVKSTYVVSTAPVKIFSLAPGEQNYPDSVTLSTSQSAPHSAQLQMKSSSSRERSIHNNSPDNVDKTASPVTTREQQEINSITTREQPRPVDNEGNPEAAKRTDIPRPLQKENNTQVLQKAQAKALQKKDTFKSLLIFPNDTTQASATSFHSTTRIPSVVLKRESRVSPIVLEDRSTEASVQLDITVKEQKETTVSGEQYTTSPFETNTGTSQNGENEPQEMGDDSFWPVVAALVIGVPAIVVIVIAITVIHKKRKPEPRNLLYRAALKISRSSSVVTLRRKVQRTPGQDNIINLRLDSVSTLSQDMSLPRSIDV
ncbi:hypothetical protein BsWGS_05360 [Bradybaena similaris]